MILSYRPLTCWIPFHQRPFKGQKAPSLYSMKFIENIPQKLHTFFGVWKKPLRLKTLSTFIYFSTLSFLCAFCVSVESVYCHTSNLQGVLIRKCILIDREWQWCWENTIFSTSRGASHVYFLVLMCVGYSAKIKKYQMII